MLGLNHITLLACKHCNKFWCVSTRSEIVKKYTEFKTVARKDEHYNNKKEYSGSTYRDEQTGVIYTEYLNSHTCKKCGQKWTSVSTQKSS